MNPTTRIRTFLSARSAIAAKATPGEWMYSHNGMMEPPSVLINGRECVTVTSSDEDAIAIADARNNAEALNKLCMEMLEALGYYASLEVADCEDGSVQEIKNTTAELLLSMDNGRKARECIRRCAALVDRSGT